MDQTAILGLIRSGESERLDFKRKAGKDIHREIVALANADGGHILIGVDDKGDIIGADVKKETETVTNSAQSIIPPPKVRLHRVTVGNRRVLVIEVERSENLCSVGGVAHIRIGAGIRPLSIQEILTLSTEMGVVEWDGAPILDHSEMEKRYVDRFFEMLLESRGKNVGKRDRKRYLRSLGALKGDKLTNAGLLFFTKSTEHIPHSGLRMVFMEDGEPAGSREYPGPVWKAIEEITDDIAREIKTKMVFTPVRRMKVEEYPSRAIREALTNAVAHRNYSIFSDIRVFLSPDGILVRSPGGLPPGLDLNEPDHLPRNPRLCNLLYDCGLIERYGLGIQLMKEEVDARPELELKLSSRPQGFDVSVRRTTKVMLDDTDKSIIRVLTAPMKSGEISKAVGISKPTCVSHLKKLSGMGIVVSTGKGAHVRYEIK